MLANLREPGGALGMITIVCAFFLFIAGTVGVFAAVTGIWADNASDRLIFGLFGALDLLAVLGLWLQPRTPILGAILATLGGIAFVLAFFWAILPLVLGPVTVVVAIVRAVKLSRSRSGGRVALAT